MFVFAENHPSISEKKDHQLGLLLEKAMQMRTRSAACGSHMSQGAKK